MGTILTRQSDMFDIAIYAYICCHLHGISEPRIYVHNRTDHPFMFILGGQ